MATSPIELQPTLSPAIRSRLATLRVCIRGYVWIEGIAAAVVWLCLCFWANLALDWLFEPPAVLRAIMLGVIGVGLAVVLYRLILRRAMVRMTDANMAMVLERRFPELDDALLTAVILADHDTALDAAAIALTGQSLGGVAPRTDVVTHGSVSSMPSDAQLVTYHKTMFAHTCVVAQERIESVRLWRVFNKLPLAALILAALLLVLSILFYVRANPISAGVWFDRAIRLTDRQWPRQTKLSVEGMADGVIRVPRGSDLDLVANIETRYAERIPSTVEIRYWTEGGQKGRANMNRIGDPRHDEQSGKVRQTYGYTFRGILAPIDFDLIGGDDRLSGLRIEVVESPRLTDGRIYLEYPAYMRVAPRSVPLAPVMQVPMGTCVTLDAWSNKPLVEYEVEHLVDGDSVLVVAREHVLYEWMDLAKVDEAIAKLDAILKDPDSAPMATRLADARAAVEQLRDQVTAWPLELPIEEAEVAAGETAGTRPLPVGGEEDVALMIEQFDVIIDKLDHAARGDVAARSTGDQPEHPLAAPITEAIFALERLPRSVRCTDIGRIDRTTTVFISLTDTDGIIGREPTRVTLAPIDDLAPELDVNLYGIGTAVTPNARVPVAGEVTDQYGIGPIWFEALAEGADPTRPPLQKLPLDETLMPTTLKLGDAKTADAHPAVLDMELLGLSAGQKIQVSLLAADFCDMPGKKSSPASEAADGADGGDNATGNAGENGKKAVSTDYYLQKVLPGSARADAMPNIGRSQTWSLAVVTPERLRIILEAHELSLRQRFEVIISEVQETRDLIARVDFADPDKTPEPSAEEIAPEPTESTGQTRSPGTIQSILAEEQRRGASRTLGLTMQDAPEQGGASADGDAAVDSDSNEADTPTADAAGTDTLGTDTLGTDPAEAEPNGPATPDRIAEVLDDEPVIVLSPERRLSRNIGRIQRALQNCQKNSHETESLARAFDDIRLQMENNRISTTEWKTRLTDRIIGPLSEITETGFPRLEDRLRQLERVVGDPNAGPLAKAAAREQVDAILISMHDILNSMLELEDFNEAIELLRAIIEMEQELEQQTKERDKQKLRDSLLGDEG